MGGRRDGEAKDRTTHKKISLEQQEKYWKPNGWVEAGRIVLLGKRKKKKRR